MPAQPRWFRQLPLILEELRRHPRPYVDRATIEVLLGIGRRRAQQILAPCITNRVGSNGLANRNALIALLEPFKVEAGLRIHDEKRSRDFFLC